MKTEMMIELIRRRKGKGADLKKLLADDDDSGMEKERKKDGEDGLAPGKADPDEAPDMNMSQETEDEMQMDEKPTAEEVLGRKPMSFTKDRDDDDEDDEEDRLKSGNKDVLEAMKDERVMDLLENGKKPTKLSDRVQMNIMKKLKRGI